MNITPQLVEQVRAAVRRDRLLDTAIALVEVQTLACRSSDPLPDGPMRQPSPPG
jgi:hypothetical protein